MKELQEGQKTGTAFSGEGDAIEGKLKELVQQHGIDIFHHPAQINGVLADFFPEQEKERASIKAALDMGAGNLFYGIARKGGADGKEKVLAARKKLIDEAWISEAASDYVCKVFLAAVGKEELLPENQSYYAGNSMEDSAYGFGGMRQGDGAWKMPDGTQGRGQGDGTGEVLYGTWGRGQGDGTGEMPHGTIGKMVQQEQLETPAGKPSSIFGMIREKSSGVTGALLQCAIMVAMAIISNDSALTELAGFLFLAGLFLMVRLLLWILASMAGEVKAPVAAGKKQNIYKRAMGFLAIAAQGILAYSMGFLLLDCMESYSGRRLCDEIADGIKLWGWLFIVVSAFFVLFVIVWAAIGKTAQGKE